MALTRQLSTQLGTLSIASIDLKADITEVEMRVPAELRDGRGIAWNGESPNAVKQMATFRTTALSTYSGATRIANVDVSELLLGATDYIAYLRGGSFRGTFQMSDELGGVGNYWSYKLPVIPSYNAEVQLNLPNGTAANALRTIIVGLMNPTIATAIANRNLDFSIAINAVDTTLPMIIADGGIRASGPNAQIVTLALQGRTDGSTTYPAAPTGSTSLLEKCFTAFATPMAFTFTPKASNSSAFAGELVPTSFGFGFNDAAIIETNYEFQSHGVVTPTTN